ncbi:D-amino-acid transaminase [Shimwellia blattae]|uniref:Aminodeoxychorismate lyase n=1 Tax=Shimwellia blattae (strain ATCC 29907 / DSM 4481 / JCM 1650 / NBRC 105725 / CDC 9005-74) TaxID=630626 RepID=I2B804_SHIBC|nr:D-amino-acid transaminase [Shimwellia blattae]AFJ46658.1 putative D-amino acid aminotransferase [Shimwellia blattae DSM 4481 = NBRC 105725]VDY64132.1 D-alanine aminotransferase [Shimwellia blattae]VEC22262.1 D-alanine aminotransferase [Shimwellia blattae]
MARTVYVNGQYMDEQQATISIFDRGALFGDAVYEVTAVIDGQLWDLDDHLHRLRRSCAGLELECPWSDAELEEIHRTLIAKNQLGEGVIYLQLSRGDAGDRDFSYAEVTNPPTLVLFTQQKTLVDTPEAARGLRMITRPDVRWQRRDLKTVSLLAASMAYTAARRQGVDDALLVENGMITEGTSSNVFIVTRDNTVITRPLGSGILPGTTRRLLIELIAQNGLHLTERLFTPEEARGAKELFISSTTALIMPVVELDGCRIADGTPGPVAQALRRGLINWIRRDEE